MRKNPEIKARPEISRSLAQADVAVRDVMRSLVTGAAPWPLYLWGPSGLGKTSASLVLLDHCGKDAAVGQCSDEITPWMAGFVDVRTIASVRIMMDKGQLSWSDSTRTETARWHVMLKVIAQHPLLVLDEIGIGREAADFRLDSLIEVLDRRANNPVRPFVVTSNQPPSEIANIYDDRVADRILCGTVKKLDGDTRRRCTTA